MKKHDNQKPKKYYYPLRRENDRNSVDLVPVTEEQYEELTKLINRKRKREQRAGRCLCPKQYFWKCDADCDNCQYYKSDWISLDQALNGFAGLGSILLDFLADDSCLAETIEKRALSETLELLLDSFSKEEQEIIRLFSEGHSEREIADKVGCSQKTVNNKKRAIFSMLLENLKDWL
jgi:DNA-directed RNA polymerase specialized sigma24 family protein